MHGQIHVTLCSIYLLNNENYNSVSQPCVYTDYDCMHNGEKNLDIKICLVNTDSIVKWVYVKRLFIPRRWKENHEKERLKKNDYAIIELKAKIHDHFKMIIFKWSY